MMTHNVVIEALVVLLTVSRFYRVRSALRAASRRTSPDARPVASPAPGDRTLRWSAMRARKSQSAASESTVASSPAELQVRAVRTSGGHPDEAALPATRCEPPTPGAVR